MSNEKSEKSSSTSSELHYHYAGITNTGMVRDHNEDAYMLPAETDPEILAQKGHLYILADGMGGHQKGEIASAITIETVNQEYYARRNNHTPAAQKETIADALAEAIQTANQQVMNATQGGGTTIIASVLYSDTIVAMNVGDSRAYLLRDGKLRLLSKDHSLVSRLVEMGKITEEEALNHPRRNVLYQALGQGGDLEIYTVTEKLQLNDVIILCSDGLWGEIGDQAITDVLTTVSNPFVAAQQLIDMANQSGGPDNITAIIIKVSDQEPPAAGYSPQIKSPIPTTALDDTQPSMAIIPKYQKPDIPPEWED
ncbi:MAG: serine/threonine-protein phosphatase [Anaerolineales bacterium]|nr:serine/threonine-protein phosphatase [Anaerolineales bacterium]